jgi:hypothetical protein
MAIALVVMLPATFCAGMTLPLITYRLLHSREGERAIGKVYAVNTLGGIVGVIVAVHVLLDAFGLRATLLCGAAIDVALGVFLLARVVAQPARRSAFRRAIPAAVAFLALIAVASPIDPHMSASGVFRTGAARMAPDVVVAYHRDGKTATVTALESDSARSIRTNGKPDATVAVGPRPPTGDEFTMNLLGILPLGHKPDAKTAAVIGFGSGMSTTALLGSPRLERVDTIEIEPAMVEGARVFLPAVNAAFNDRRSRIVIDDAKSFFARGKARYDIVVSEPSNPWVSGVASLFTEEFYSRVSRYLNDDGVFSQWLHVYEMDDPTFASIIKAMAKTFPDYVIYSTIDADIVLIARKSGATGRFDPSVLKFPGLKTTLERLKLTDPEGVLRRRQGTSHVVQHLFAEQRVLANSDYFPVVDTHAARTRFMRSWVGQFTALNASAMPLREMLDGDPPPAAARIEVLPITYIDNAASLAWSVHDAVLGEGSAGVPIVDEKELSGRLAAQWAQGCSADLSFERVLPAMVTVAEATSPYLHPGVAEGIWRRLGEGRCAKGLVASQRDWLDLFAATARRDSRSMAALGTTILAQVRDRHNPASEYAFFAAVTARVCRGEHSVALRLLDESGVWVRPGVRASELAVLRGLAASASPASCPA